MNEICGTMVCALGGLAGAVFALPFRGIKGWRYESYWLVYAIAGLFVFPLLLAGATCPGLFGVIRGADGATLAACVGFGALWGIGGLTWGLMIRYLGIGLGLAVGCGLCSAAGTLIPPIVTGRAGDLVADKAAVVTLASVVVSLLGIVLVGLAGKLKENELDEETKRKAVKDFDFKKGMVVACFSGIASAGMNFGLQSGASLETAAAEAGAGANWVGMPVLVVVLWGGFAVNAVWCVWQNAAHKSPAGSARTPARANLLNLALASLAGVIWACQFACQKIGEPAMGSMRYISFAIVMGSCVLFSSLLGVLLGEWKGTSPRTRKALVVGLLVLIASFALSLPAAASTVKIVGTEGAWSLERNGKPYFVRGAGGVTNFAQFAGMGGNSTRTWGADKAAETLDAAAKHGVTVTIGFWLPHQGEGARYADPQWCEGVTRRVLETVRSVKDRPGLLFWALGNEAELGVADEEAFWKYINWLAGEVKAIDPNHPVGTVIAEVWQEKVDKMTRLAPNLDWIGINTYGGGETAGKRWREMGGNRPYLITEFGPPGPSELGFTWFGCPNEWTSTAKADWYERIYRANMVADRGTWCLGSYAFVWGVKVEGTPTWFGLLTPEGEILAAAERLQTLWGRKPLRNHVPTVSDMTLSRDHLEKEGETLAASVSASDADGDALSYTWSVMPEMTYFGETAGLPLPDKIDGLIVSGQGTPSVTLRNAKPGKFRLYCTVRDARGGAAISSKPVLLETKPR